MNADAIRNLYTYHFALNRKLWDESVAPLTDVQFKHKLTYSVGSIRNQMVHMMNIDDRWFSGLRGEDVPGFANPQHYGTREKIRAEWDVVEAKMRDYLDGLRDEMLGEMAFDPMHVWQVLLHVINHGTDHRAQSLAMLDQLGAPTFSQDYALYLMGKL